MSTTETHDPATAAGGHHDHHPGPREYVRIAIILAVLTALEVSTYFVDFGALAIPLLIVLMSIKFVMVAGFFMHLRFDTKLYGRFLYGGLFGALGLYGIALIVMFFDAAPRL
ncbi:MAG TPA: cytochrome C oxidase subunit IV family protein [Egicoccus sp.]|nr:cytochrome C oxidase subunit IV family protein [Egicoccus sp.]HSK23912.1 cytochrome C oxidase subunit IV family protein [Egicoccus sp.]